MFVHTSAPAGTRFGTTMMVLTVCSALVVVWPVTADPSVPMVPGKPFDAPKPAAPDANKAVQGEEGQGTERVSVLVHLQAGADRGPVRGFVAAQGAYVKYEYDILPNVINVRNIPKAALNGLLNTQGVVRWETDRPVRAHMNDSTPLIRALQSQITGAGLSADGSGVRVCIIDTGIDSDHAMYSTRIDAAAGRDFVNNDNNPEDDAGHGAHVAGTAVGGDNLNVDFGCVGSEPFQGVAPQATLIGIKVLNAGGSGTFSDVIAGINYGADQSASGGRCDVINMSLGGGQFSGNCDGDSAAAAANNAVDAGVVVVASSGNDAFADAMGTPACGSKVISVGLTYDDDYPSCEFPTQTSFTWCLSFFCLSSCTDISPSVDEVSCMSNKSSTLDVTAPGCITFSADHTASPFGIVGLCGTSMSSPHVAGLAALLLSADPSLTPADVRQHIRDGAIDLGPAGFDNAYGWGRIDAINSLSLLGPACTVPADCDDGDVCNGAEDCVAGSCVRGTSLNCDDGVFCNGSETCSATLDCQAGTAPTCDDGVGCTDDSCNAGTDSCDNIANNANCPDDGFFCNGTEFCDAVSDCSSTGDPCPGGTTCNEATDTCDPPACNNDGTCDAGEDCNNCPNDCFSGSGGFCGDGICAGSANGEDCFVCSADCRCAGPGCNACCGDGFCGNNGEKASNCPVDCDPGFVPPSGGSCCGDGTCDGTENVTNCAIDCGCSTAADCDDSNECTVDDCVANVCQNTAVADGTSCNAGADLCCGGTCTTIECDVNGDCDDGDACSTDTCLNGGTCSASCDNSFPACQNGDGCCPPGCTFNNDDDCPCGGHNAPCSVNGDCCSGNCRNNGKCSRP